MPGSKEELAVCFLLKTDNYVPFGIIFLVRSTEKRFNNLESLSTNNVFVNAFLCLKVFCDTLLGSNDLCVNACLCKELSVIPFWSLLKILNVFVKTLLG